MTALAKASVEHAKPIIKSVTLELSDEVAQFLLELTGAASGMGLARVANDSIYDALSSAGFSCAGADCSGDPTWLREAPTYEEGGKIDINWECPK